MFCLANIHFHPYSIQKPLLLLAKSFSSFTSADSALKNGTLQSFIGSIVCKSSADSSNQEQHDFVSFQNQLVSSGVINNTDSKELTTVLSAFDQASKDCEDPKTILTHIKQDTTLSSFLVSSKRSITVADYCAYFLLYPLFSSIQTPQEFESLSSYYMRMQNNKDVRSSPLAPPLLQLKPKKQKSTQTTQQSIPLTPEECLAKLDIRVGKVVKAWNHPDSDKLLCEQVDVGEETPRSIGSGIRGFHKAEEVEGRLVCVMCNMKGKKLAGYPSNGMLLCASTADHLKGSLINPPSDAIIGERILFEGINGDLASPNQVSKKKMVETVLPFFKVNSDGTCCFKDIPFSTTKGVVTCKDYPNEQIS